jgi:DNA-directed RNA polymerase subunit RPC12/RpoP
MKCVFCDTEFESKRRNMRCPNCGVNYLYSYSSGDSKIYKTHKKKSADYIFIKAE